MLCASFKWFGTCYTRQITTVGQVPTHHNVGRGHIIEIATSPAINFISLARRGKSIWNYVYCYSSICRTSSPCFRAALSSSSPPFFYGFVSWFFLFGSLSLRLPFGYDSTTLPVRSCPRRRRYWWWRSNHMWFREVAWGEHQ